MRPSFIVGYDGTESSRAAVRFATRFARGVDADVVAVHGYEVPAHSLGKGGSGGADAALADDSRAEADLTLAELHEEGVTQRIVRPGSPAQALIEAADELDAELIVVGTHEAQGLARLKPGSTAERIVHGAPCPVSIVPHDARADQLATIAVAYDGREPAQTALTYGAGLARAMSARLVLITAGEPFSTGGSVTDDGYRDDAISRAEQAAEGLRGELDVEVRLPSGATGEAIVSACGDDVDLLITGSRAYGPVHAVIVGGVSHYLAAHTRCPVIVVPRQVARMPTVPAPVP